MYKFLIAALLAVPAVPASAIAAAPNAAAPNNAKPQDEVICKRETVVGSRVKQRRVCMTRREQTKLQQGTRDGVDDYLRRATAGAPAGG